MQRPNHGQGAQGRRPPARRRLFRRVHSSVARVRAAGLPPPLGTHNQSISQSSFEAFQEAARVLRVEQKLEVSVLPELVAALLQRGAAAVGVG